MIVVEGLKNRRQFLALGHDCQRYVLPSMIVLVSNTPEKGSVKIGFTASKKVGNAVIRAKAKRRMRAVFDESVRLNEQFKSSGLALNLIARAYITNRDFKKMVREFKKLLEKELKCVC